MFGALLSMPEQVSGRRGPVSAPHSALHNRHLLHPVHGRGLLSKTRPGDYRDTADGQYETKSSEILRPEAHTYTHTTG